MGTHHMSAVDSAWLRMDSPGNLLVVNAIFWTEEPVDFDEFRTVIGERMIDRFPRFRQHPGSSRIPMGRAEWVDDEDFDVERHYRYVTLDAPGDEAALQAYVSSQTGIPLDPTHPLWEIHFISGFGNGSAAFFRIHHAIADGIALTRVMLSLTDDGPRGLVQGGAGPELDAEPGRCCRVGRVQRRSDSCGTPRASPGWRGPSCTTPLDWCTSRPSRPSRSRCSAARWWRPSSSPGPRRSRWPTSRRSASTRARR